MKHKKEWGPGYRFFECEECHHEWKEICRDCTSPSCSTCPKCHDFARPVGFEAHYEWPTDNGGNLIEGHKYE